MKQNFKKGFTLIELLVVIAIIGILAAITVVSVQGPRNKATDTKTIAELRQYSTIMEQYYGEKGAYPIQDTLAEIRTALEAEGFTVDPLGTANGTVTYAGDSDADSYCIFAPNKDQSNAAAASTDYIICAVGSNCTTNAEFLNSAPPSANNCVAP